MTESHILRHAALEIRRLRNANMLLAAQIDVVNVFKAALLGPPQPQGMSEDMAWRLEQEADKLDAVARERSPDGR